MALKKMELQYEEAEDGMLYPVMKYPKQPAGNVGKYGELRRAYLEQHRKATCASMKLSGTLKQHLMDVDAQANEMLETQIQNLLMSNPAPDKATDTLGWVQHMNSLKRTAEEIVLNEVVYA